MFCEVEVSSNLFDVLVHDFDRSSMSMKIPLYGVQIQTMFKNTSLCPAEIASVVLKERKIEDVGAGLPDYLTVQS
jgi:hypothetical protein